MGEFNDRVVIVTGASDGIGRAFCRALAPQRPRLVLAARARDRLETLAHECRGLGAAQVVDAGVVAPARCDGTLRCSIIFFCRSGRS